MSCHDSSAVEAIARLRDEDGLSFHAISQRLGLSKKIVQSRYYRAADSDQEQITRACELHDAGLATREIAGQLHVHEITVARWTNVSARRGRPRDLALDTRVVQLREEQGLSFGTAAKMLGISRSGAWYRYRRSGSGHHSEQVPPGSPRGTDVDSARILRLRDHEMLSWRAIASMTGMSPAGIRARYNAIADAGHANIDRAREMHQVGLGIDEIARRLLIHEVTIARWTGAAYRQHVIPTRPPRMRPSDERIVQLRDEGLSFDAIAARLGDGAATVRARYNRTADSDLVRIARARELRLLGLGAVEIAGQLHVHEATVLRWTGQQWRPGRPRATALDRRIARLRDEDLLSFDVIAGQVELTVQTVRRRYRIEADRSPTRIDEARDLCRAGLATSEIAQRLRVHEDTVRRWTGNRPSRGRPPRLDVQDEIIRRLRDEQGLSFRTIAQRTGMSESGAWNRYKRLVRSATAHDQERQAPSYVLIRELRDEEGLSFRRIGERIGLSPAATQARYKALALADSEAIARARDLHQAGMRTAEIARRLRVHQMTVAGWTGVPPPRARRVGAHVRDERIAWLRDEAGLSFKDVAKQLGISKDMVRKRYNDLADASQELAGRARVLLDSGLDVGEIALELGVHARTVCRWTGVRKGPGRLRGRALDERIRQLRDEQGLSFEDAGRAIGLTASAARRRYERSMQPEPRDAGREEHASSACSLPAAPLNRG
jgi:transposase/transcriptional regulator with XRE-family HTH domain